LSEEGTVLEEVFMAPRVSLPIAPEKSPSKKRDGILKGKIINE
jgi:hypothetical protein